MIDLNTLTGLLDAYCRLYVAVWQGGMKWSRDLKPLRGGLPLVLVKPAFYYVERPRLAVGVHGETRIVCIHSNGVQRPFGQADIERIAAVSAAINAQKPIAEVNHA